MTSIIEIIIAKYSYHFNDSVRQWKKLLFHWKKYQNAPQSAIILDESQSNLGILVKYEVEENHETRPPRPSVCLQLPMHNTGSETP